MDAVGNRLSKADSVDGTTSYVYDANDRLLNETNGANVTNYVYDDNGNTKSKTKGTDITLYSWNDQGRLVSVQNPSSDAVSYEYNENGIRVSSTINGVKTSYLLDANRDYAQVLEEYDNSGTQVSYVYGHDLISQSRNGAKSFYLYDGLGSTKALTDASGVVTDRYIYDAYGNVLSSIGTTQNSYLYTGEQFDAGAGQYYLRDRYYNQAVGRFTRSDSFAGSFDSPLSLNKYLYANGNPINFTDPSGLTPLADFVRLYRSTLLRNFHPHIWKPWIIWMLVGGEAHRAIQTDIVQRNATARVEFGINSGGRADVHLIPDQYYEIKPAGGSNSGETQLDGYIQAQIAANEAARRGTTPLAGIINDPPTLPGIMIDYGTATNPGLIYYTLSPSTTGLIVIAFIIGAKLALDAGVAQSSVAAYNFTSTLALTKGLI